MHRFLSVEEERETYACAVCGEECGDDDWGGDAYFCHDCIAIAEIEAEPYDDTPYPDY